MNTLWQQFLHQIDTSPNTACSPWLEQVAIGPKQLQNTHCIALMPQRGSLFVTGSNAAKFLQGQITCDVNEVNANQSRYGAHCNAKGRVLFTFRLYQVNGDYLLQLPLAMIDTSLATLRKYAIFFKSPVTDTSNQWLTLGISGPQVEALLQQAGIQIPNEVDAVEFHNNLLICRLLGSLPRYEISGSLATILPLWHALNTQTQTVGQSTWELLNILANIPEILPKTSGLLTPHEINYPNINGVSFKKGCYIGQEIVARMQYLGKLKNHLQQIRIHNATNKLAPGMKLFIQQDNTMREVGILVNHVAIDQKTHYGLATLQDSALNHSIFLEKIDGSNIEIIE